MSGWMHRWVGVLVNCAYWVDIVFIRHPGIVYCPIESRRNTGQIACLGRPVFVCTSLILLLRMWLAGILRSNPLCLWIASHCLLQGLAKIKVGIFFAKTYFALKKINWWILSSNAQISLPKWIHLPTLNFVLLFQRE